MLERLLRHMFRDTRKCNVELVKWIFCFHCGEFQADKTSVQIPAGDNSVHVPLGKLRNTPEQIKCLSEV